MSERMDDEKLLNQLQMLEEDSADFTFGALASARRRAAREYYRRPYGNEEDGWSQIVTSEVQDTIEAILPWLLEKFTSSDDAVEFEPTEASDVDGADQATQTCNYVFYKQNNGFLVLYTAFKDSLMSKNCAVHWRIETVRSKETVPVQVESILQLSMMMKEGDEIDAAEQSQAPMIDPSTGRPAIGPDGQPMMRPIIRARICRITERKVIKVEAFEPENLLIKRDWTSPALDDCPYVARTMPITLSDVHQMGFEGVTAEELAASTEPGGSADSIDRRNRKGGATEEESYDDAPERNTEDESLTTGWLRIEWVLCDFDGDGIAERREIYRLKDMILSNEECAQVPVSTGSPMLVQHRWDGMSIAEIVSDLQLLKTELTRGVVNNAVASNNPRKLVQVGTNDEPLVNVDDLLDSRPGVHIRVKGQGALQMEPTMFVGHQMFPLLEYIDQMGEKRTGVSKQQQGLDPNTLRPDRTAAEVMLTANAAQTRINLMARILAETVVKPIFKGILRLLTQGEMEPIAFRLRGEFVKYDPNEWRDGYDMTVNVGTGTGDKEKQAMILRNISAMQMALAPSPLGEMMVTPQQIYAANAEMIKLGGFKNVGEFLKDPGPNAKLPTKPPEPPPPQVMVKQMELQAESQRFQAESQQDFAKAQMEDQRKQRELDAQNEMQRQNDERDAERAALDAKYKYDLEVAKLAEERYKVDADNKRAIMVAHIAHPEAQLPPGWGIDEATGELVQGPDPFALLMQGMETLSGKMDAPSEVVRDPETGAVIGVAKAGQVRPVVRDESGRVVGLQ